MSKEDLEVSSIVAGGACIMSNSWRDEQHPSFIEFISSFLIENSYRLNFLQISPDFIVNNGGISIAFIFITNWRSDDISAIFTRIQKLKRQFANLYVVVTLPTEEQNISFTSSYFKYNMELGKPTFVPVQDLEMGFEKIVKIANVRGVCKRLNVISKLNLEREQSVQSMSAFLKVVTSIPGIDNHDANTLIQTVGSIEAISRASKEYLLENTDLSSDKVETIIRFFRDPKYYAQLKLN